MWDNLMPGTHEDDAADAYEYAVERAWRLFSEDDSVPVGIGWDIADEEQDRDGAWLFRFEDAGGYTHTMRIDPYDDQEYEPHWS